MHSFVDVAVPVAWYAMNSWLNVYEYKVNRSWWIFTAEGGLVVLVALIVTGFRAIKVAIVNCEPCTKLKTE